MYTRLSVLVALTLVYGVAAAQDAPGNPPVIASAARPSPAPMPSTLASYATPDPSPRPAPPYSASGEFEVYPWQVGLGYSYVRFSNVDKKHISFSGVDTSVSYFFGRYIGVEGEGTAAFGTYLGKGGSKFAFYGGGVRIANRSGHRKEPWGHLLIGGVNVYPQTAFKSTQGLAIEAGGGYDYRLTPRVSVRAQGDWIHSRLYTTTQNNIRLGLGFVLNF